jgi:hypothetical protein
VVCKPTQSEEEDKVSLLLHVGRSLYRAVHMNQLAAERVAESADVPGMYDVGAR